MVNKEQIDLWVKDGTVTQDQANKMLADSADYKKEQNSNKLIVSISTIGALFLGIGAILFVASNWQAIPSAVKVLILVGSTFSAYFAGYVFQYQKQNLPKVGASLIFLGALLFGASVFLIAQIYNINANSHILMLIWLAGVLPLVYAFQSSAIAELSAFLFYAWIGLFMFRGMEVYQAQGDFFKLPVLYLSSGVLLFGIGQLHYFSEKLKTVARIYRLTGIKIAVVSLFFLTFRLFSGNYGDGSFFSPESLENSGQFTIGLVIFSVLALLLAVAGALFNPSKSKTNILENSIAFGLAAVALLFFFFPATTNIYVILFNLILTGLVFTLIFVGYQREDLKIVNTGMFWLFALVLVRYFDFFWELLERSVFFIVGGVILVLVGIALEKKRGQIKAKFKATPPITPITPIAPVTQ
jgi:uncharacterized membrane protein